MEKATICNSVCEIRKNSEWDRVAVNLAFFTFSKWNSHEIFLLTKHQCNEKDFTKVTRDYKFSLSRDKNDRDALDL